MVGDIDFIFSKEDYPKAITILREFGYSEVKRKNIIFLMNKHYRRLQKENNIAAIEIHKDFYIEKYTNEFNYSFVEKDSQSYKWSCCFKLCKQIKFIHHCESNKRQWFLL